LVSRLILIASFLASGSAFAALGDHEQVVSSDAIKLKSSQHLIQKQAHFTIHELETPIAQIREFVDSNGQVFAVSWRGIRRPDLSVLLGSFYEEYNNIDSRRPRMITRAPVNIQTSRILVRKGGHMRDIKGLAVISDQLPSGVRMEDLQ
jgi:hypothetical protein